MQEELQVRLIRGHHGMSFLLQHLLGRGPHLALARGKIRFQSFTGFGCLSGSKLSGGQGKLTPRKGPASAARPTLFLDWVSAWQKALTAQWGYLAFYWGSRKGNDLRVL